jgi:hypothetical protein
VCLYVGGPNGCIDVVPGEFITSYATTASTAATLSNLVGPPVLDETGLDGHYSCCRRAAAA